jgi:hypothetical protein
MPKPFAFYGLEGFFLSFEARNSHSDSSSELCVRQLRTSNALTNLFVDFGG